MPVRPPSNERGMNAPYLQHLEDSPLPLYAHPSPSLLGFGRYASLLLVLERGPKRRKLTDSRTHSSLSFDLLTWSALLALK